MWEGSVASAKHTLDRFLRRTLRRIRLNDPLIRFREKLDSFAAIFFKDSGEAGGHRRGIDRHRGPGCIRRGAAGARAGADRDGEGGA